MAINSGAINTGAINAPAGGGPGPAPLEQVPLNMDFAVNDPPLPVEPVPLNMDQGFLARIRNSWIFRWRLNVRKAWIYHSRLNVRNPFTISASFGLRTSFKYVYTIAARITPKALTYIYSLKGDRVTLPMIYPARLRVAKAMKYVYPLRLKVSKPFTYVYGLNVRVTRPMTYTYNLNLLNRLTKAMKYYWSLFANAPINVTGAIELILVKTGQQIGVVDGAVSIDEGQYTWSGSVQLADPTQTTLFDRNDAVIVRVFGEDYNMLVDSKSVNRQGPEGPTVSLRLISVAAAYAFPRADRVTQTFDTPIAAQDAAEALLGTTITWNLVNWVIPANRLAVENADPVEAVSQIVEAAGGVLQTNPDGTFVARNLYPVRVPDWPTAIPDQVFTEAADLFAYNETIQGGEVFNKFRIREASDATFGDRIIFEADDGNSLAGEIRVFASPWRTVTIEHTSDAAITLTSTGIKFFAEEQVVEFKEGEGSVSFPVFSIQSVTWMDDDLGSLIFETDSTTLTSVITGYGLAKVKYTTRAMTWRTSSPITDQVQYLVVDP